MSCRQQTAGNAIFHIVLCVQIVQLDADLKKRPAWSPEAIQIHSKSHVRPTCDSYISTPGAGCRNVWYSLVAYPPACHTWSQHFTLQKCSDGHLQSGTQVAWSPIPLRILRLTLLDVLSKVPITTDIQVLLALLSQSFHDLMIFHYISFISFYFTDSPTSLAWKRRKIPVCNTPWLAFFAIGLVPVLLTIWLWHNFMLHVASSIDLVEGWFKTWTCLFSSVSKCTATLYFTIIPQSKLLEQHKESKDRNWWNPLLLCWSSSESYHTMAQTFQVHELMMTILAKNHFFRGSESLFLSCPAVGTNMDLWFGKKCRYQHNQP